MKKFAKQWKRNRWKMLRKKTNFMTMVERKASDCGWRAGRKKRSITTIRIDMRELAVVVEVIAEVTVDIIAAIVTDITISCIIALFVWSLDCYEDDSSLYSLQPSLHWEFYIWFDSRGIREASIYFLSLLNE